MTGTEDIHGDRLFGEAAARDVEAIARRVQKLRLPLPFIGPQNDVSGMKQAHMDRGDRPLEDVAPCTRDVVGQGRTGGQAQQGRKKGCSEDPHSTSSFVQLSVPVWSSLLRQHVWREIS